MPGGAVTFSWPHALVSPSPSYVVEEIPTVSSVAADRNGAGVPLGVRTWACTQPKWTSPNVGSWNTVGGAVSGSAEVVVVESEENTPVTVEVSATRFRVFGGTMARYSPPRFVAMVIVVWLGPNVDTDLVAPGTNNQGETPPGPVVGLSTTVPPI